MFGGKLKYYLLMHMVIFIWGFTGVLGKLLDNVPVHAIVFYRMLIGFLAIGVFMLIARKKFTLKGKSLLKVSGTGVLIAGHWITFFASIYYSNVSFALVFFSTTALFTSFIEPVLMKKKFNPAELIMAIVVVGGISIIAYDAMAHEDSITNENLNYGLAIGCALISAFLAASFSVINAIFVRDIDSYQISFVELMSGCIAIGIVYFATGDFSNGELILTWEEFGLLLILGSVCTAFAFLLGNWLMKFISPFTMNLSVNMEPIYAILIALFIFPDSEVMTPIFYIGAGIIIGAVVFNGIVTSQRNKRKGKAITETTAS